MCSRCGSIADQQLHSIALIDRGVTSSADSIKSNDPVLRLFLIHFFALGNKQVQSPGKLTAGGGGRMLWLRIKTISISSWHLCSRYCPANGGCGLGPASLDSRAQPQLAFHFLLPIRPDADHRPHVHVPRSFSFPSPFSSILFLCFCCNIGRLLMACVSFLPFF